MSADAGAAPGPLQADPATSSGVIHNIGYRRYDAARLGRAAIVRALVWHSLRAAFGIGRGAKAKIFPVLLFALMCLPAAVSAVGLAIRPGSQPLVAYDAYVPSLRTVAMLLFVALEAPNLVSSDLRNHTLPLYFARPIRRIDYPAAKLAAFVLACLVMIEIPLLLLYLGTVSQVHGAHQVWEQTLQLGPGLLYGAAWAVLLASLGLLAGLRHRQAGIRDLRYRHPAVLHLDPGQRADARRPAGVRPGRLRSAVRAQQPGRPDQPVHAARRGAEMAARESAGPGRGPRLPGHDSRQLRPGVRGGLRGRHGGCHRRPHRPLPEGWCGVTTIELAGVSRWYGNVVAVNDVTMTIGAGVTGLLGPNGAGKTTILHLVAGFLAPSRGEVTVAGSGSWRNPAMFRQVGVVPERDSVYAFLTGSEFVTATARLHGLQDPDAAARRAIGLVEMAHAEDRRISTYSKGMRQRIKVAAALVHDPEVVLLDEPFNGMDPRQRLHMMDLLHAQGSQGRVIVFSSHILEEVERLSGVIQVIVGGRLAASGDFRAIRRLMTGRPHVFLVRSSDDRALGAALIGRPAVSAVELTAHGLQVRASDYGAFTREVAGLSREHGIRLTQVLPADESLESVFNYLVAS